MAREEAKEKVAKAISEKEEVIKVLEEERLIERLLRQRSGRRLRRRSLVTSLSMG